MRIREPREDAASAEVDAVRPRECVFVRSLAARDPVTGDRERARDGRRRFERPDDAVLENHGRSLTRAGSHTICAVPFTLRNIKVLDERVVIPAMVLQLVTGLAMTLVVRAWWSAPWMLTGLVLFAVVVLLHLVAYRPVLGRLIELLDRDGIESPSYQAAAGREMRLGIALVVLMVVIVFLMVVKPALWAAS